MFDHCHAARPIAHDDMPVKHPKDAAANTTSEEEAQLRQTLLEYQAILDNASLGITFTRNRTFLHCNERFSEMFGWESNELVGHPTNILYPSPEAFEALGRIATPTLSAGKRMDTELLMKRRDGSLFWCRMLANAIDPKDHSKGSIFITEDISTRKQADEALHQSVLEQQAIFDNALIGIAFLRGKTIQRCNQRMEALFAYPAGQLSGASFQTLYSHGHENDADGSYLHLMRDGCYSEELLLSRRDGGQFWCHLSGNLVDRADPSKGSVWLAEDITERRHTQEALVKARDDLELRVLERTAELARANARLEAEIAERRLAEEQVRHLAHHDALTGLPNRRLLEDRIEQALVRGRRNHVQVAVLFIDLDRFKLVNDTYGHHVGDQLLQEVANRLRTLLREGDTVSRVGGDEFILVLPDMQTQHAAQDAANRIIETLARPYLLEGHALEVTPSIGIAMSPMDGNEVETLICRADAAMYMAKQAGRKNYQFYNSLRTSQETIEANQT